VHHHVKQHWSTLSEKFQEPQTSGEEKAAIRALLPQVLADPSVKIRNAAVRFWFFLGLAVATANGKVWLSGYGDFCYCIMGLDWSLA
jgi:hypothetical protein